MRRLVAGPSAFICDECIALCQEIIEENFHETPEEPEAPVEETPAEETPAEEAPAEEPETEEPETEESEPETKGSETEKGGTSRSDKNSNSAASSDQDTSPNTGDNTNVFGWLFALLASGAAVVYVLKKRIFA